MEQLTALAVAALVGAVMSFVLAAFPKLSDAWLRVKYKVEIMAVVFVVAPFVILGLTCNNVYLTQYICPAGAFATPQFYVQTVILGLTAFAGSQWGYIHGAKALQDK